MVSCFPGSAVDTRLLVIVDEEIRSAIADIDLDNSCARPSSFPVIAYAKELTIKVATTAGNWSHRFGRIPSSLIALRSIKTHDRPVVISIAVTHHPGLILVAAEFV